MTAPAKVTGTQWNLAPTVSDEQLGNWLAGYLVRSGVVVSISDELQLCTDPMWSLFMMETLAGRRGVTWTCGYTAGAWRVQWFCLASRKALSATRDHPRFARAVADAMAAFLDKAGET